jgi:hypothetical protein
MSHFLKRLRLNPGVWIAAAWVATTACGSESGAGVKVSPVDAGNSADGGATTDGASGTDTDSSSPDAGPVACTPAQLAACDDKLACTTDGCDGKTGACSWTLAADSCLIGSVCRSKGEAKAGEPCRQCDPAVDAKGWSLAAAKAPCDDGLPCSFNDRCEGQSCVGDAVPCDDGNACTADVCDPKKGCQYPPLNGSACSDGSPCTDNDSCVLGACVGQKLTCSDGNPCTDDACDLAKGCTHTDNAAPCSDDNACTTGDVCAGGKCGVGPAANCDDGNTCTIDVCEPTAGCVHLPTQSPCCTGKVSICDDGNPCTSDDCAAGGGCSHQPNSAPCSDGDACTSGDTCKGGSCAGGGATVCDDKNPCTTDACSKATGCVHAPLSSGGCDDGNPCTSGDTCALGVCAGKGQCACTPSFAKQASKFTAVQIGNGGKTGEALDLDNNPATCAPSGSCSGGVDNALGLLASIANPPLGKAVEDGSLTLVLEYKDWKQGPVLLAFYTATLDASSATCNPQTQTCAWQVAKSMISPTTCQPLVSLPGTLTGNALNAGGKGSNFPLSLPLSGGAALNLTIYGARVQGTVAIVNGQPAGFDGLLGGAVPKADLLAAIDGLPDAALPLPKDGVKALLDGAVQDDIDTNGDGKPDAASIGFKLKGIGATIAGSM